MLKVRQISGPAGFSSNILKTTEVLVRLERSYTRYFQRPKYKNHTEDKNYHFISPFLDIFLLQEISYKNKENSRANSIHLSPNFIISIISILPIFSHFHQTSPYLACSVFLRFDVLEQF